MGMIDIDYVAAVASLDLAPAGKMAKVNIDM